MFASLARPCVLAACCAGLAAQNPSFFTNPQPLNLGATGSEIDFSPTLNAAETTLIFASTRAGGLGSYDLYEVTRPNSAAPWGTPVALTALNTSGADYEPTLSADGLELYFISTGRTPKIGSSDCWAVTRPTPISPWGTPVNLGAPINGAGWTIDDPFLTDDGLTLFYTSSETGAGDIYAVTRPAIGQPWGNKAGFAAVNQPGTFEHSPTPEANGKILWFSSTRTGGPGSSDFYVTWFDTKTSLWSAPVEVRDINTSAWESNAWRRGATGTIYWSYFGSPSRIYTACPTMVQQLDTTNPVAALAGFARPTWPPQTAWLRAWTWPLNSAQAIHVCDCGTTQSIWSTLLAAGPAPAPIQIPGWIGTVEINPSLMVVLGSGLRTPGIPDTAKVTVPNNQALVGGKVWLQSLVLEITLNRVTLSHPAEIVVK